MNHVSPDFNAREAKPSGVVGWLTCWVCWEVKVGLACLLLSRAFVWASTPGGWGWTIGIALFWIGLGCLIFGLVLDVRVMAGSPWVRERLGGGVAGALEWLEGRPKSFLILLGLLLVEGVGALDFLTGSEMSVAIFYLVPVSLVSWFVGAGWGAFIAEASILAWLAADVVESGSGYSNPVFPYWNAAVRLGLFFAVVFSLSSLRRALAHARTDYLTDIPNSRAFFDMARVEIARARRYHHMFTFAYLDIDDFKTVNDRFGHRVGDELLRTVATTLRRNLRATDVVCRLGGDEFAILLSETDGEAAKQALGKLIGKLGDVVGEQWWPITFSVGAVTFTRPPEDLAQAISQADELMYAVKRAGKNRIQQATFPERKPEAA